MEIREIAIAVGALLTSPALVYAWKFLQAKKKTDANVYISDLADRRAWTVELMAELKELRECNRLLQEENLRLERANYRLELQHKRIEAELNDK